MHYEPDLSRDNCHASYNNPLTSTACSFFRDIDKVSQIGSLYLKSNFTSSTASAAKASVQRSVASDWLKWSRVRHGISKRGYIIFQSTLRTP